jgi:hypothetical protein
LRFSDWKSLRRNWIAGVIGLLFTIVLVAAGIRLAPVKYVTNSQMVLLPPLSQEDNGVKNPYMGLEGLQSMASVVANAMSDDTTAKSLRAAGVSQYSVEYDSLDASPVLIVQVTEPTAAQASAGIEVLDTQVPLTVARLQNQAAISPKSFITARVIARPSQPARSGKTQLRIAVLALVVGLVLTLLAMSVSESWRVRRRHGSPHVDQYDDAADVGSQARVAFTVSADSGHAELANESAHDETHLHS